MHVIDTKKPSLFKLCVDGASRANPGMSGVGICIINNGVYIDKFGFYTGIKTNNQAEYLALIMGLFFLKHRVKKDDSVMIVSDSELMVRQIKGEYRVKNEGLQPLYSLAKKMLIAFNCTIAHVPREQNSCADEMANIGIDQKIRVPDEIIAVLHEHTITL
jgi:ribonuclease HI